jgi:hypothetical protein
MDVIRMGGRKRLSIVNIHPRRAGTCSVVNASPA